MMKYYETEISPKVIPSPMNKYKSNNEPLYDLPTIELSYNYDIHCMTYDIIDDEKEINMQHNTACMQCLIKPNEHLNDLVTFL